MAFHGPHDPSWAEALERTPHDLYHLPEFAQVEADWLEAEATAFIYRAGGEVLLLPLLLRESPRGEGRDAVTPYGYSSPVFSPKASAEFRRAALAEFHKAASEAGVISTFIRLHPLLQTSLEGQLPVAFGAWREVDHGSTVDMPLEPGDEDWLMLCGRDHRYDVRKLGRDGYTFELDTNDAWQAFSPIYQETMERLGAGDRYRYSETYVTRFRSMLGERIHCAAVRAPDDEIACAGLFSLVDGIVQYHLSGTRGAYWKRSPMKLMLAGARAWAREEGARHFHLGGGVGAGEDSLFAFKSRFGGKTHPFRTVQVIHRPAAFAEECRRWEEASGMACPEAGFFPPYRAPLPVPG